MPSRRFLLASLCLLAACGQGETVSGAPPARRVLEVQRSDTSRSILDVEIADTPELQSKGLMFRDHLDENQGMLFQFAERGNHVFWMKNTHIPLDMLFINKGRVVGIIPWARPMDETPLDAGVESDSVLEVNGGWVTRTNTGVGAQVILKDPKP